MAGHGTLPSAPAAIGFQCKEGLPTTTATGNPCAATRSARRHDPSILVDTMGVDSGSKAELMSAKPSGNHFVQTAVVHWGCRTRPLGPSNDGLAAKQGGVSEMFRCATEIDESCREA